MTKKQPFRLGDLDRLVTVASERGASSRRVAGEKTDAMTSEGSYSSASRRRNIPGTRTTRKRATAVIFAFAVCGWKSLFVSHAEAKGVTETCGGGFGVRKVQRLGRDGLEILVHGERAPMTARVNERECATMRAANASASVCIVLSDIESARRAMKLVMTLSEKGGRDHVQVWASTLPPRLICDKTNSERETLRALETFIAAGASGGTSEVAVRQILDVFTIGDREHEEGDDVKFFVLDGMDRAVTHNSPGELIDPPRSGSVDVIGLSSNAAEEIDRRRNELYRIKCCAGVGRLRFLLEINSDACTVRSPNMDVSRHLRRSSHRCVAKALEYPYADDITLEFSQIERETFETYRSFYKGSYEEMLSSKREFPLGLRFDAGPRVKATARFRGVSSFRDCKRRKSLAVELHGGSVRLMPGSLSDKFLLISLCIDDRYVKTHLVLSMARKLGLFPHQFRYVRLRVHTRGTREFEHLGLYLLMDDPRASLERQHNSLSIVVRRRSDPDRRTSDPDAVPDVKTFGDGRSEVAEIAARVKYERVVLASELCDSDACYDDLNELMDVDLYLRFIALMTLVQNGDYVDELFLYSSNDLTQRFKIHAWDPDDSFETCHHGGIDAIGSFDWLYCSEGAIDRVLLRSNDMVVRYLEQFNYVVRNGITELELREIVDYQEREIRRLLVNDVDARGLEELRKMQPSIDTASEAIDSIVGSLRYYENLVNFRRRALLRDRDVYAVWDPASSTEWTKLNSTCIPIDVQARSYSKVDQEILLRLNHTGSFALNVSFDPTVVFENSTYIATQEEFVLEAWSLSVETPSCIGGVVSDGFIVISSVCDNQVTGSVIYSVHHRFYHSFANINSPRSMTVQTMRGCGVSI